MLGCGGDVLASLGWNAPLPAIGGHPHGPSSHNDARLFRWVTATLTILETSETKDGPESPNAQLGAC